MRPAPSHPTRCRSRDRGRWPGRPRVPLAMDRRDLGWVACSGRQVNSMPSANAPNFTLARSRSRCWVIRGQRACSAGTPGPQTRSGGKTAEIRHTAGVPEHRPASGEPSRAPPRHPQATSNPMAPAGAIVEGHRSGTQVDRGANRRIDWIGTLDMGVPARARPRSRPPRRRSSLRHTPVLPHPPVDSSEGVIVSVSIKPLEDRIVIKSLGPSRPPHPASSSRTRPGRSRSRASSRRRPRSYR